jgi:hypothetical protein
MLRFSGLICACLNHFRDRPASLNIDAHHFNRHSYIDVCRYSTIDPGNRDDGRRLGVQLIGRLGSEIAKRIDTISTAIFTGLTVDAT